MSRNIWSIDVVCKNYILFKWNLVQTACYSRSLSGVQSRQRGTKTRRNDFLEENEEENQELEDVHDFVERSMGAEKTVRNIVKQEQKFHRTLAYKTIERKYFKGPQEINLLTWDAKEQIRFLHQEYPDEWTVDRLADSFPISRDGVLKILKSAFRPRTLEEITRHDRRVQKNWKALNEGLSADKQGGPLTLQCRELLAAGQMALLANSASNPSLPMPDMSRLLAASQLRSLGTRPPGIFELIVKDYCEKTKPPKAAVIEKDGRKLLLEHVEENRKLAGGFLKLEAPSRNELTRSVGSFSMKQKDRNTEESISKSSAFGKSLVRKSEFGNDLEGRVNLDFVADGSGNRSSQKRRCSTARNRPIPGDKIDLYELQGEQKIPGVYRDVIEDMAVENAKLDDVEITGLRRKYNPVSRRTQPDVHRDVDAYIYDEHHGYQYPYGRKKDLPNVKVVVNRDRSGGVIRKSKDVYDEDGEFLYRIS